jgi:hypothetical protein
MITRDNWAEIAEDLFKNRLEDIQNELDKQHDFMQVTLSGYGHIFIESMDYDEESEEEALSCGGMFCDKDDFLRLFSEVGIEIN